MKGGRKKGGMEGGREGRREKEEKRRRKERTGRAGGSKLMGLERQVARDRPTEVGAAGHRIVHFIDVQKMNSKSGLLYQTEKESLKLNLWKLFYRKNTKLNPTYKNPFHSLLYEVES